MAATSLQASLRGGILSDVSDRLLRYEYDIYVHYRVSLEVPLDLSLTLTLSLGSTKALLLMAATRFNWSLEVVFLSLATCQKDRKGGDQELQCNMKNINRCVWVRLIGGKQVHRKWLRVKFCQSHRSQHRCSRIYPHFSSKDIQRTLTCCFYHPTFRVQRVFFVFDLFLVSGVAESWKSLSRFAIGSFSSSSPGGAWLDGAPWVKPCMWTAAAEHGLKLWSSDARTCKDKPVWKKRKPREKKRLVWVHVLKVLSLGNVWN